MFVLMPVGSALADTASPSEQARELLVASIGVGPGQSITDKALAIQEAVDANPTDTPTACVDLASLLGEVRAQAGKHLSQAAAATLTTDADNLEAALGC
jgi:hypothetical protein